MNTHILIILRMRKEAIVIISKRLFVDTMNGLRDYDRKMDVVDTAIKELDKDFGGLYITAPFDLIMPVLEGVFHDEKSGWLSYLVYEKNWLEECKPGDVTDENDEEIDLSTWDKVYDFLVKEMEAND